MAPSSEVRRRWRSGQALVESLLVLLVTCLLLFGLLEVSRAFTGREIMRHAAARAARARAVGFNRWMCEKVMRVAAIPASGTDRIARADGAVFDKTFAEVAAKHRDGETSGGALWDWAMKSGASSARAEYEMARIPAYLASVNRARANALLDYEGWDDISYSGLGGGTSGLDGNVIEVSLRKRHPLPAIFARALNCCGRLAACESGGLDKLDLRGDFRIEAHYPLYIDDMGW